jgi:hypothetical protein
MAVLPVPIWTPFGPVRHHGEEIQGVVFETVFHKPQKSDSISPDKEAAERLCRLKTESHVKKSPRSTSGGLAASWV